MICFDIADPVRMFEHEPCPPDAVLKFFSDVYASPDTSDLLYTNDANVLLDIIIRQLTDLPPGDKVRYWNIKPCWKNDNRI